MKSKKKPVKQSNYYSVKQAANLTNISEAYIYRQIRRNNIKHMRVNGVLQVAIDPRTGSLANIIEQADDNDPAVAFAKPKRPRTYTNNRSEDNKPKASVVDDLCHVLTGADCKCSSCEIADKGRLEPLKLDAVKADAIPLAINMGELFKPEDNTVLINEMLDKLQTETCLIRVHRRDARLLEHMKGEGSFAKVVHEAAKALFFQRMNSYPELTLDAVIEAGREEVFE